MPGDKKVDVEMKAAEEKHHEVTKTEIEVDAPSDKRAKLSSPVEVDLNDCSMNVVPSCGGKVLMTLADGGLQYLSGCVRVNAGVKAGRYLFEVKIVEARNLQANGNQRAPGYSLHLGLTGAGSSLHLADNANSCAFNNDGMFMQGKWKTPKGKPFKPFDVVGLLVNVDAKSPNANTASLFINGVRASDPQRIPEALHGKPLFPTINFKNLTLHLNMGPDSLAAMPFTCRMVQDAAQKDMEVTANKTGKKEVIFPVGIPNEGTFRFLDGFLEANPGYTELSDRAIVNWARTSGVWPAKSNNTSNDKPGVDFGIREMEEVVLRKSLSSAASYHERNCVVMEVKGNLLSEQRTKALAQYDGNSYKKVAVVAMGEPPKAFKDKVLKDILEHKQWKVAAEVKKTKEAEAKEKAAAKAAKEKETAKSAKEKAAAKEQAAKEKAKAKAEKKAKAEADKKAAEKAAKDKAVDASDDDGEKKAVDLDEDEAEKKVEEVADEESEEPEKEEESAAEEEVAEEPEESLEEAIAKAEKAVELTDEEKAMWFPKGEYALHNDLTSRELGSSFSSFSLPSKEEGFDEIRFVWAKEKESEQHLQAWVKEKKLTQKVEDLTPGTWFKEQLAAWQRLYDGWHDRQRDWNDPAKRERKKEAAERKRKAKDGDEGDGKVMKENSEDEADAEMKDDFDANDIDAFHAEDINDLGNGEPLYAHFAYEDWTLMSLRFELHLLVHAFVADMNDPERPLHDSLVGFYFKKYFKKDLSLKLCNCSSLSDLMELVPDILEVCQSNTLGPLLSNDSPMDNFLRMTEDMRRERMKLAEAGDETAVLKFDRRQAFQQERGGSKGNKSGGGKGGGKGGDRSGHGGKPAAAPTSRMGAGGPSVGRAAYGTPPSRAGYGQGPPPAHGPPSYGPGAAVGYGPGPGHGPPGYGSGPQVGYGAGPQVGYGPGPGSGYGAPPGYGPPPSYGAPPGRMGSYGAAPPGAYGPPPGHGGPPHGQKRGGYGAPAGAPPERRSRGDDRGGYGGGGGRR